MKRFLLAITAASLMFVACKKEETNDPVADKPASEKIAGEWNGVSQKVTMSSMGTVLLEDEYDMSAFKYIFNNDGTYDQDSSGVVVFSGSWSSPNNEIVYLDGLKMDIDLLNADKFECSLDSVMDLGGGNMADLTLEVKFAK